MKKCLVDKCDNFFPEKKDKNYCSRKCKSKSLYSRKSIKNVALDHSDDYEDDGGDDFTNPRMDIFISYRNITHYLKLGYNAVLNTILNINILDLPSVSHVRVNPICKSCNNISDIQYNKYLVNKKRNGKYTCKSCRIPKLINIIDLPKSEDRYVEISNTTYLNYRREVRRMTKRNEKRLFEIWNGIDYYDGEYIKDNFRLSPYDKNYPSIDHKISILFGFRNDIDPQEISDLSNLCITKIKINSTKRDLIEEDFFKIFKPKNNSINEK